MKRNRTKIAIADAFIQLLNENTIDKITVKMITDAVGCSRKTFYYYFTDVYELTRFVCDNHVQTFMGIASGVEGVRDTFLALVNYLNEHRQVVWFAEKSHETASSVYTRADKFGLHKNLSLYNSYRIGRLGAKPELGSPFIDLD